MRKIGVLMGTHESDPAAQQPMMEFRSTLATLGWVDGRNISLEIRWYGGESTRANEYARVLVALAPDVIVVTSTMGGANGGIGTHGEFLPILGSLRLRSGGGSPSTLPAIFCSHRCPR